MSDKSPNEFTKAYSDESFWDKVQEFALSAGIKVIYAGLLLFYALKEPDTPAWAKGVIFTALGYFVSPFDAIPDFVPVAGYADDSAPRRRNSRDRNCHVKLLHAV